MLTKHNPVFVEPIKENLNILNHSSVVVRFIDGTESTGEPVLYYNDSDTILLKWAYSSMFLAIKDILAIAPRHYDTIEDFNNSE